MKTKTLLLTLLITLITTTLLTTPQTTQAATHTQPPQPPQPHELWESGVLEGWVNSVAWSPDGTKLAAGVGWYDSITYHGKVIVLSPSSGNVLWESGDLSEIIYSVAWSPQGNKLAIGSGWYSWASDHGYVVVFSPLGEKLWESSDLGGGAYSVAWSPQGDRLVAGTSSGKVVMLSSTGSILWESGYLGGPVRSVAFSPQGDKIAVGGDFRKVILFSPLGEKLWESSDLGEIIYSVAWSPQGDRLVAGTSSGKVVMLSSTGSILWESGYLGGPVQNIAWSPNGSKVAVGGDFRKVILFSPLGEKLWESSDLGGGAYSVAWSPQGNKLAIGIRQYYSYSKVVVFSWVNFGVVSILGSDLLGLKVCFFDGSVTNCYVLNSSGLRVYADPGNYEVRFYLTKPPNGIAIIGDTNKYLKTHPITKKLKVTAGENYTITPPIPNEFFGRVIFRAPEGLGLVINVSWGSGFRVFEVASGDSASLYAVPGEYEVHARPEVLGSGVPVLRGVLKVPAPGSSVEYSLTKEPLSSVGFIRLSNPSPVPASVNVSWGSGFARLSLGTGKEQVVPVVKGEYSVEAIPRVDVVGYGVRFVRKVSVPAGGSVDVTVDLPIGSLRVSSSGDVVLLFSNGSVAWRGGGGSGVWVGAGDYVCRLRFTGSAPQDLVGDLGSYWVEVPLSVEAGAERLLDVESSVFGSLASLRVVGPAEALVRVSWPGGSKSFTIPASGVLELRAVPGTEYRVTVSAPDVLHSDFTSVVRVSAGAVVPVYVSFPFSPVFYGLVLGVVGVFGASFYMFGVRPRVSVRLLTKEVVEGVTEFLEVEFRNSGLKGASFEASISVDGVEVFSGVVEVPGRSRKVVKLPLRSGGSVAEPGGVEGGA